MAATCKQGLGPSSVSQLDPAQTQQRDCFPLFRPLIPSRISPGRFVAQTVYPLALEQQIPLSFPLSPLAGLGIEQPAGRAYREPTSFLHQAVSADWLPVRLATGVKSSVRANNDRSTECHRHSRLHFAKLVSEPPKVRLDLEPDNPFAAFLPLL